MYEGAPPLHTYLDRLPQGTGVLTAINVSFLNRKGRIEGCTLKYGSRRGETG